MHSRFPLPLIVLLPLSLVVLLSAGCGESPTDSAPVPGNESSDRIEITNDENALKSRVTHVNEPVEIEPDPGFVPTRPEGIPTTPRAFTLELLSRIRPPSYAGSRLQATSVALKGNFAIVSYNMRGAQYLGAIDVIQIRNGTNPVIRSTAIFTDTDINSVSLGDQFIFAAVATGEPRFEFPAALQLIAIRGGKLTLNQNRRFPLTSYAGTSAFSSGGRIFATSGDGGGLHVLDPQLMKMDQSIPLHDARWVHVDSGKVVVAQGTPGQLSVFEETTLTPIATHAFDGADIPESKSTVEVVGGKAFVAAGTAGVQILSVDSGAIVGSIPIPDPARLGLDPSVVVTNAVTVDEDLIFISNGEAGVFVVQGAEDFSSSDSETEQRLMRLGRLRFGELQSVNHVAYKDKRLVIASGLGGIKIVRVHD